ncbi:hypothetical protein [Rhizobium sp. SG741]|uniref:hypothetical protein n=1 Tax=Rhizobium sp. SG741 TaxID=2587114 RepID=UPI0014460337|nr:hypothetical protein [Rhizobium sp. SG741]NKJ09018.1 hypothetical protein [Rhizobium sp. SG741]
MGALNPFKITIVSGFSEGGGPDELFARQWAAVLIENRSYRPLSDCVLHVQAVKDFDNQHRAFPRLIKEFSIRPGEIQQIEFLSWTVRKAPLENDKTLVFCGPVGWGWGGNYVALPCGSYNIEIRISVGEVAAAQVSSNVWIEGGKLKAARAQ